MTNRVARLVRRGAPLLLAIAVTAPVHAQDRSPRPERQRLPGNRPPARPVRVAPDALARETAISVARLVDRERSEILRLPGGATRESRAGESGDEEVVVVEALDAGARRRAFQQHPDWPPPPPERDFGVTAEDPDLAAVRLTPRSPWHPRAHLLMVGPMEVDASEGTAHIHLETWRPWAPPNVLVQVNAELEAGARYLLDIHVAPRNADEVVPVESIELRLFPVGLDYTLPGNGPVMHLMAIVEPQETGEHEFMLYPNWIHEDEDQSLVLHAVEITRLE